MFRKICVLSFLLILVAGTALNAAKPEKQTSDSQQKGSWGYPLHCLQNFWLDYPGDGDVYQSVKLAENCGSTPVEELWYGVPQASDSFPEDCELCESDHARVAANGPLPPHKLTLSKTNAWRMLQAGLEAHGTNTSLLTQKCHKIPQGQLPAGINHDVCFLAVPLPPPSDGKITEVRYLGIETRALASSQLDSATFTRVEARDGRQLWIEYTVGSETRKGYVWLKD